MCGILGLINIDAPGDILDLIRHRGPDSAGETNLRVGVHDVFLGHRRLSIVDLSPAGHQPMRTPDGSAVIVYNDIGDWTCDLGCRMTCSYTLTE
jgi:asparagine synthase (glutamine-hydrolysing)